MVSILCLSWMCMYAYTYTYCTHGHAMPENVPSCSLIIGESQTSPHIFNPWTHTLFYTLTTRARELESVRRLSISLCRNLADTEFISTFLSVRPEVFGENAWLRILYTHRNKKWDRQGCRRDLCLDFCLHLMSDVIFLIWDEAKGEILIGQRTQGERMPGNFQLTRSLPFSSLCVHYQYLFLFIIPPNFLSILSLCFSIG